MKPSKRIRVWIAAAFLIGAGSCFGPRVYPYDPILRVSLWLSAAWAVFVVVAIVREKKQGLWLLLTAPLALFTPMILILWEHACRLNINACP